VITVLLMNSSIISYAFKALVARGIAMSLDIRRHPPRTFPARFDFDVQIVEAIFVVFRPRSQYLKSKANFTCSVTAFGECLRKSSYAE
jgi:hypothetical protein